MATHANWHFSKQMLRGLPYRPQPTYRAIQPVYDEINKEYELNEKQEE
jgi:hypothetical protein